MSNIAVIRTGGGGGGAAVWTLIAETILGAPAAVVTFAAIPGTYRALIQFQVARSDVAGEVDNTYIRFNGDAGASYDWESWSQAGIARSRAANQGTGAGTEGATSRANCFAPGWMEVPYYTVATVEKYYMSHSFKVGDLSADGDMNQYLRSGHWRDTNAITSITLFPQLGANWVTGSRFVLYGIT